MLELTNLDASYGFLQILWGVNLHVAQGELVGLIGPNGAGKSTTLRTVAGLLAPSAGSVQFKGNPIEGQPAYRVSRMGISYVSESLNLFTDMTVRENLILGAYAVKDKDKVQAALDYIFELFPRLGERRSQLAGTMSGGERKMLAIARGIMSDPQLMLVDEPSLGLAPYLVTEVFRALQKLQQRGMTILLVEQRVNATLEISDRAYVMEQGRIVLEGLGRDLATNEHVRKAYMGI